MATVHVIDDYYLVITLLITIGYQLFFFSIAWTFKFDKLTDLAGGTNFVVLAIITLAFSDTHDARQIVASLFLMLWAARLSGFLFFRILKTGSDSRFDDKRDKFFPFLGFWVFQMVWVWTVSLPVTILNSPAVKRYSKPAFGTASDIVGVIFFAIAFVLEAWADAVKYRFKAVGRGKTDKGAVCDEGPWYWSRHPNYFGEIMVQFSIFMIAVSPAAEWNGYNSSYVPRGSGAYAALYASMLGPFFLTFLLLFVSGLPLNERPAAKKRYENANNWPGFKAWLERTSILIPMPPQLWSRLPVGVKRTVGMEWPMYVFNPAKHADQSKADQAAAENANANAGDEYHDTDSSIGRSHGNTKDDADMGVADDTTTRAARSPAA